MCGIAGIAGRRHSTVSVESLSSRIAHRGPDGHGVWKNEAFALAHVRLSIIDLSDSANQPMEDPLTGNILIFNGEIYNYIELRQQLGGRYDFRTQSDTEVILACYRVYGEDFLQKLRGMFTIALYDHKRGQLLLARDRVGIKPLYYRPGVDHLLFASEIKALVNWDQPEQIQEEKLFEFLASRQLDCDTRTLFKNVFQLPAASYTWCDKEGKLGEIRRYWTFPALGTRKFDADASAELNSYFNQSLQLHLRSDVPVGSFLSGGLDSTSVACYALKNMERDELHAFSAVLPYFHPENSLIDDVLATDNRLIPHKFSLDGQGFFEDIFRVIYHHDEPVLDGSMYAHFKLCEMASQAGIKVLLSGSGGDELFGGYFSYVYAHLAKRMKKLDVGPLMAQVRELSRNTGLSAQNLLMKALQDCTPFAFRRYMKNRLLHRNFSFIDTDVNVKQYYFEDNDPYYANLVNNFQSWTVPPYLHYEDRNSMAFGVEVRVPFYDHHLIEFMLQFDDNSIIRGSSKSIMREAFKGVVPDKVLQQKGKYGFPSPIDHALKHDEKARELFHDLLAATPFLKKAETEKMAQRFYNGEEKVDVFFRTLSYIIWYQVYFRNGWKAFSHAYNESGLTVNN